MRSTIVAIAILAFSSTPDLRGDGQGLVSTVTIRGVVVEGADTAINTIGPGRPHSPRTARPVPSATVHIADSAGAALGSSTTGADGTFVIRSVNRTSLAQATITASAPGFSGLRMPAALLRVDHVGKVAPIEVNLVPAASLTRLPPNSSIAADTPCDASELGNAWRDSDATLTQCLEAAIGETLLRDISGHDWSRAELSGKPTLLVFWSRSCGPCVHDFPKWAEASARKSPSQLRLLGVSLDKEPTANVARWAQRHGWAGPHIHARGGFSDPLVRRLGITGLPTTILLDAGGRVIAVNVTPRDLDSVRALLIETAGH